MKKLRSAMFAVACAAAVVVAVTSVYTQGGATSDEYTRHLLYIGTPGDNGTDNQSGVVVLDADKNFSFIKRISYDLPAAQMPGGKVSGIAASVPLQMLYVAQDGSLTAIDLTTDKIAWRFTGEKTPVAPANGRRNSSPTGCCERPWVLPDGETLLVASHYNGWWYYIDGATGEMLYRLDTPEANVAHNLAVSPDGQIGLLGSMSSPSIGKAGLAVIDVPARKIVRHMTFTEMVRPLTMMRASSMSMSTISSDSKLVMSRPAR